MARRRGRPAWVPKNPEHAERLVESLAGLGHSPEVICKLMDPPCSGPTIRAYYADLLVSATETFRARAEGTLARLALGVAEVRNKGRILQKGVPPDRASLMFLLKTRFGYREVDRTELSFDAVNISSLTDAQLDQLVARLSRSSTHRGEGGAAAEDEKPVSKVH